MIGALGSALMFLFFLSSSVLVGLFLLAYGSRCLLVVVQGTSMGADSVHWPDEAFLDWVTQSAGLVCLIILWLVPAGILARVLGEEFMADANPALRTLVLAVPVLWLYFPFGALSSLSSVSRWVLFRPRVAMALLRVFPSLLGFYLSTALVGVIAVAPFYLGTFGGSPWLLLIAAPLSAAMVLIYSRLLGRLGWIIRQLAPIPEPKKAGKPAAKPARTRGKKAKVNDPWATPIGEPDPPPRPKQPLKPWQDEGDDVPYELADAKKPALEEETSKLPKRVRPLDEEELDALEGYGVSVPPMSHNEEKRAPEKPAWQPREPEIKLAWPLLQGVYSFPWYGGSVAAWMYLMLEFLLLGLLLVGCLAFSPTG
jgi:hypothetical protein